MEFVLSQLVLDICHASIGPQEERCLRRCHRTYHFPTPDRSSARFELTPEVNRHSPFSRYQSSLDHSSSVEDQGISPRAGLQYKTGYSGSSNLPKLKFKNFDGNPLEWPEWSSMFIATVNQRATPDSEKMSHLKSLLTGKAMSAKSGKGYVGQFYSAAWSILERKASRLEGLT